MLSRPPARLDALLNEATPISADTAIRGETAARVHERVHTREEMGGDDDDDCDDVARFTP